MNISEYCGTIVLHELTGVINILALAVNIIIVHFWDAVFPRAKTLRKPTPLG
jgi:hypothetical protein